MTEELEICEVCGEQAEPYEIEVMHRGCRLRAAFPAAATSDGNGLVSFNMDSIRETLGWTEPIRTSRGLEFNFRWGIWVSAPYEVGGSLGSWSWNLSEEDMDAVVSAYAEYQAKKAQS